MSNRYKGGVLSATPPTTSSTAAPGIWTLEQQMQATAGTGWPAVPTYIEDVFSTWLYTGTGATQTITNGINLAGQGGLLWIKNRSVSQVHRLFDTARGNNVSLSSDSTSDQASGFAANGFSFNANGFTLGSFASYNQSSNAYVSWTFREQAKFFDVVTYTGDGSARTIAHNLGSVPGCIIVKAYSGGSAGSQNWPVYHTSIANTETLFLNLTDAKTSVAAGYWNSTTPTSTVFSLGTANAVNQSGTLYVAYLFAHDAGGFGALGTDNVISCGSFTAAGPSSDVTVNLGYEPQWILMRAATAIDDWYIYDVMRGMSYTMTAFLKANSSAAEGSFTTPYGPQPTATGFIARNSIGWSSGEKIIYIAIRRGPMKVPTVGTSVFAPNARTGNSGTQTVSGLSFSPDLWMTKSRNSTQNNWSFDKLRGIDAPLSSNLQDDEATNTSTWFGGSPIFTPTNTGFTTINQAQTNSSSVNYIDWLFGRAPGFFDEVCYKGTGADHAEPHNLKVAPELIIIKGRSPTSVWGVYTPRTGSTVWRLNLNATSVGVNTAAPMSDFGTASNFYVGTGYWTGSGGFNTNTATYVAYLFATLAGVSKVGNYTGTGALLTVNCGFTTGARFVLIKRADDFGPWYVWDSARGISSSTDPHTLWNSDTDEVTGTNYVDTDTTGFKVTAAASTTVNVSGGTYIFLAIA